MAVDSKLSHRAMELLARLSTRGRRAALDYIEYLAEREEVVLPEEEASLREDLVAAEASRKNSYRKCLTLDEVRHQLSIR
jgi:hypothetical protein